jgi:hypothetical protein
MTTITGISPKTETFSNKTSVTVYHNLGYKPIVWVVDTSGNVLDFALKHNSDNSFTMTLGVATSGTINYR